MVLLMRAEGEEQKACTGRVWDLTEVKDGIGGITLGLVVLGRQLVD